MRGCCGNGTVLYPDCGCDYTDIHMIKLHRPLHRTHMQMNVCKAGECWMKVDGLHTHQFPDFDSILWLGNGGG